MDERGVSLPEVSETILNAARTEEIPGGEIRWGPTVGVAWHQGREPGTHRPTKCVVAVLLVGINEWADDEPFLISDDENARSFMELFGERPERSARPERSTQPELRTPIKARTATRTRGRNLRKGSGARSGPVVVRNIFDGVPETAMDEVRRQLEALGRDPNDLSVVKRKGMRLTIEL